MKPRIIILAGVIFAVAVVAAAYLVARPWISLRYEEPIKVTGYAEIPVKADSGVIEVRVSATAKDRAAAYKKCAKDVERLTALVKSGFKTPPPITELDANIDSVAKLNDKGKRTNIVDYYFVARTLRIESADVEGIEKCVRTVLDLNAEGVRTKVVGPSYFVNNLDDIKMRLVEAATANGRERALIMAEQSGAELGDLVAARQGVVQITKPNSSEISSWGVYDTGTIEKVAKLAVTVEYKIE